MRHLVVAATFAVAVLAQQVPAQTVAAAKGELAVAEVNGEILTRARFDELWNALAESVRQRYEEQGGGRTGYLESVVQRRVVLQEAVKRGYHTWPEVASKPAAERENALFDVYVREVVAPRVVTEEVMQKYYDANASKLILPERVKLRLIAISTARRMPEEARAIAQRIAVELFSVRPQIAQTGDREVLTRAFAAAAAKYSEHPSAAAGGDLGWVDPDKLDPVLGNAARNVRENMVSGLLELADRGYALVLVEKRRPAGVVEYEAARDAIRDRLMARAQPQILAAAAEHARELRAGADVKLLLPNLE